MHTIQQIINNQKSYKNDILKWISNDLKKIKNDLFNIKSDDEYIQSQVKKLKVLFKKTLYKKEINKLFFMHTKRNKCFYIWWNAEEEEAVILSYGKK